MSERKCIVGVRKAREIRALFELCIRNGNVYVNYLDGNKSAHTSYHASGQQHIKESGNYVEVGGEPLKWFAERPQEVLDREDAAGFFLRWESFPVMSADEVFEVPDETAFPVVRFQVTVVGADAADRGEIVGFPVLDRRRIVCDDIIVEVEMLGLNEELARKPWRVDCSQFRQGTASAGQPHGDSAPQGR